MTKKIGLLFGMERSFPGALAEEINRIGGGKVVAEPVLTGAPRFDKKPPYDVILDRISQGVPFYRFWLKQCCYHGIQVVNNPFWWEADDKYFGCMVAESVGVAVPKTVLLPHHERPEGTEAESFSNLQYPLNWDEVFSYLGFPIFMKPADGGGWKDVYKCDNPDEFFAAYNKTHTLTMMAQEAIDFDDYFRCYGLGREHVHIMRYDPNQPHHLRYVRDGEPLSDDLKEKLERDVMALCGALGYDFNTVELAMRDGVPIAIDFTNPAPDAERTSVGDDNFAWIVENSAKFLVDRALNPRPFETTGEWPLAAGLMK
ncbi:MAG: ATP-grasp domain-containing protein [Planctomycetota bacterium]|jgi:hypothetical protein